MESRDRLNRVWGLALIFAGNGRGRKPHCRRDKRREHPERRVFLKHSGWGYISSIRRLMKSTVSGGTSNPVNTALP